MAVPRCDSLWASRTWSLWPSPCRHLRRPGTVTGDWSPTPSLRKPGRRSVERTGHARGKCQEPHGAPQGGEKTIIRWAPKFAGRWRFSRRRNRQTSPPDGLGRMERRFRDIMTIISGACESGFHWTGNVLELAEDVESTLQTACMSFTFWWNGHLSRPRPPSAFEHTSAGALVLVALPAPGLLMRKRVPEGTVGMHTPTVGEPWTTPRTCGPEGLSRPRKRRPESHTLVLVRGAVVASTFRK